MTTNRQILLNNTYFQQTSVSVQNQIAFKDLSKVFICYWITLRLVKVS